MRLTIFLLLLNAPAASPSVTAPQVTGEAPLSAPGLTIRLVDEEPDSAHAEEVKLSLQGQDYWLEPTVMLSGDMVAAATIVPDPLDPLAAAISVQCTPAGKLQLARLTGGNVGKRIAFL